MRDGKNIISALYNDRALLPDDTPPGPHETCYRQRTRKIHTLFGQVSLSRNYHHHRKTHTGRCPLDAALALEGSFTPAVARLLCRAASQSGSYQEGADDLAAYTGLRFDPRDLGRLVAQVAPGLRDALVTLPPAVPPQNAAPVSVLYLSSDGTGTPMRREELQGRPGKQEDGSARTREAKLGCVFIQTRTDEKGQPIRDPGSTSYVGTYQGCREAGIQLRQEALRRGLGNAAQIVYLGDGAAWLWENRRLNFLGCRRNPRLLSCQRTRRHPSQRNS